MTEALDRAAGGGIHERGRAAGLGSVNWLGLAATPAFILMAWLTTDLVGGAQAMVCGSRLAPPWLGGMTPMYLLMGLVHARPWLSLIGGRSGRDRARP